MVAFNIDLIPQRSVVTFDGKLVYFVIDLVFSFFFFLRLGLESNVDYIVVKSI